MIANTQLQKAVNGKPQSDPETVARVQFIKSLHGELDFAIPPAVKKVMTPDRMCRLAITAMRQVRNLNLCTFESLAGALMVSAQLGLEPCTPLQHCYLIPRKNGRTGLYEATFQIGYQGMLELAYRTETVKSVTAKSVHRNDEFIYEEGLEDRLVHRPYLGGDRGDVFVYYAIIKFVNGGHAFDVMSHSDMVNHMERFAPRDYKSNRITGPWSTDFDEMAKKTMIRRLFKFMRKSTDVISKAVLYDDRVIDRDINSGEIKAHFEAPPQAVTLPQPIYDEPEDDATPESEPEPGPKPAKPAPQRRKAEPKAEAAPAKPSAPFDDSAPKPTAKAEPKPSPVAQAIVAMEAWAAEATAKHDADGLPDLADRNVLMERIYDVFARQGLVNVNAKGWYSWLNEIARIGGDAQGAVRLLDQANKTVTDDYMGAPTDEDVEDIRDAEEALAKVDGPSKPGPLDSVESHGQRVAAIEKWLTDAGNRFVEKGVKAFAKPEVVLDAMYRHAATLGIVKGKESGWRPRVTDLANCKLSLYALTEGFSDHARAIVAEHTSEPADPREPGADG